MKKASIAGIKGQDGSYFSKFLLEKEHEVQEQTLNVGTGVDISIKELAETIKKLVGFDGSLVFDDTKPDGTPRKLFYVSKINKLRWKHKKN